MPVKTKYLLGCTAIVLALCFAQIRGSTILILACLAAFLALLGWTCSCDFTLPVLLFFLPWSPLMRTNPASFSFFTLGLIMVCAISVIKKRFQFRRYHIVIGIYLAFMTLLSKLLDGSWIAFDYLAFLMLIVLFPVVKEECAARKYDFYQVNMFFSIGIILAALCAQNFVGYGNISKYITMHSYSTIVRFCGFYGDPNFYAAQITAALAGGFYGILSENSKRRITTTTVLIMFLIYCGFISGSKSFVLVFAVVVLVWVWELMRMRGKAGQKIILIIVAALAAVYIASSALFGEWIDILLTRFSFSKNLSSFTTGRTELWLMYLDEIFSNPKVLLLGKGFTNVKINDRGSHNTVLQLIYQLGIVGVPAVVTWAMCFFKGLPRLSREEKRRRVTPLILLIGAFMPWLAIDIMFFDELFLLPWFVFAALQDASWQKETVQLQGENAKQLSRSRQKVRLVWK